MRLLMLCAGPSRSWLKLIGVGVTGECDYGFYPIGKTHHWSDRIFNPAPAAVLG